ncbi:MAG: aldo/keto reductase [Pseudomonadota bacterium]|nr:aldo/keto reductase [Pseudomonadota bacterium]
MHMLAANGANIPAIGLGTWTLKDRQCADIVSAAIAAGYRHIDTAAMYDNEAAVGEGIRAGGVARDELFVTTKVWPSDLASGRLQQSVETSLERLGLDHVDLALVHWPSRTVPLAETIAALNDVAARGMARHIGVSNFTTGLLEEACALSSRPLACNQVEYHPHLDQTKVHAACLKHGMAMIAYCPLGRDGTVFEEPAVRSAAEAHERSPSQVVLRWHVQQEGVGAIPRTTRTNRLAQNLAVFDFELSREEMAAIGALGRANRRICDFEFSPEWDAA